MRVGLAISLTMVNACYRGLPLVELQDRGHEVVIGMEDTVPRTELLHRCDVVYVYRFHDDTMRRLLRSLRQAGIAIVWDNDDDLTGGAAAKGRGDLKAQRVRSDMIRTMELAHVVTTPSRVLAMQYRDWGAAHVEVVENFLPFQYEARGRAPRSGITVGWTAADEHRQDLRALRIRETLSELLSAHPALQVESVGIDLGLPADRYRRHPLIQYQDLASYVAAFDIGIAPLADTPINHARANSKLKEYAAAGVPWLASPIGPYADMGERQGGRLVPDDGWYEALDRLIRSERDRRKLAKRGRKWAEGERAAKNLVAWERALESAIERARAERA